MSVIIKWFQSEIRPWIDIILEENPNTKYLVIILVALIMILIILRSCQRVDITPNVQKEANKHQDGFKNFKGDTWYPDGKIWHEKTKSWEEPDYNKK